MNEKFLDFVRAFSDKPIAVAVSGGVDSICLLHWLAGLKMNITALHVHHHLRDAADTEAQYVADTCKQLNIPYQIFLDYLRYNIFHYDNLFYLLIHLFFFLYSSYITS